MKDQIKAVQDYFRNKIVSGDFEIKGFELHTVSVMIDEKYRFDIWTANEARWLSTYGPENFISLDFSNEEKAKVWGLLEPQVKKWKNEVMLDKKKREYEALKAELGIE